MNDANQPSRFQGDHIGDAEAIVVPVKEEPKTAIQASETGLLVGRTIDEQWRIANAYHKSGLLPKHFTTPEKILVGMQFAYELGLKPLTAMRQIAVINGIPSMYGDLPLAVCRASGAMEYIQEYFIDKNGKRISEENGNILAEVFGAICITKRKGDPEPVKVLFTFDDARKAGIIKNVWLVYPKRMLQMRARSQNLKDNFPDCINGMPIAEYDLNVGEKEIESEPKLLNEVSKDINALLSDIETPKPFTEAEVVEEPKLTIKLNEKAKQTINDFEIANLHASEMPFVVREDFETKQIKPEILEKKAENVAKAEAVKAKVKKSEPKLEVVKTEYVFSDGRFVGQDINSVPVDDLTTYYYQLKAKAKSSGTDDARDARIGVLGKFLGL